jgi:protein-disulfide isomerase
MTGSYSGGRPSPSGKGMPPTTRRSARQQRLAQRQARALERAGTHGRSSSNRAMPLLIGTALALVVAVVVIGLAYVNTQKATPPPLGTPQPPVVKTPTDIPQDGTRLGDANAQVTLDLWSDFRCTACFDFAMRTEPKIIENYVRTGKIKVVYHNFIVIDGYERGVTESRDAAAAALCAADQGKFWLYHDWLFRNQSPTESTGAFTKDRLIEIGRLAGLDMTTFQPCVENGTHIADVETEQGAIPTDASGSPGVYLNGTQVLGPIDSQSGRPTIPSYEIIAAEIDKLLSPSGSASPVPSASPSATAESS